MCVCVCVCLSVCDLLVDRVQTCSPNRKLLLPPLLSSLLPLLPPPSLSSSFFIPFALFFDDASAVGLNLHFYTNGQFNMHLYRKKLMVPKNERYTGYTMLKTSKKFIWHLLIFLKSKQYYSDIASLLVVYITRQYRGSLQVVLLCLCLHYAYIGTSRHINYINYGIMLLWMIHLTY